MLRLSEIKLPLDHPASAIAAAILQRLAIAPQQLLHYNIVRRAYDARKISNIYLVYTLDVAVDNEAALISGHDAQLTSAPDRTYQFVAQAPTSITQRPVVIGTGPCGLFAGLILAQMG